MSLLSAHHVSRVNALIHSAYLSSICLHYNHAGIIGFPPACADWCFYFRVPLHAGFHLVMLAPPEAHSQEGRAGPRDAHDLESSLCARKTKAAIVLHTQKLSRARGGGGKEGPALPDRVCLKSDHSALLCEISDDIKRCFSFLLV